MRICGLHKTTLIDYPGKIACVIFMYGCNFRCGFCHNPELVVEPFDEEKEISHDEFFEFLKKRQGQLEGVCITGGEPLMRLDEEFLKKIRALGYKIKLDTNGTFPEKLRYLLEKGLVDYVAMDIKGSRERYKEIVNAKVDLEKIEKSIKEIWNFGNYEFRTTIVEKIHDEEEMKKIGEWLNKVIGSKPKKYFLQGFKNQGKFIDENYKSKKDTSEKLLKELKKTAENYFEEVGIR